MTIYVRIVIVLCFVLSVGLTPQDIRAQTAEQLQAQIAALLVQIAALQQQLASPQPITPVTPVTPSVGGACPSLIRNLRQGMSGSDVASFQSYLIGNGYLTGSVTGFFGPLTERAVQSLQSRNGIISYGTPDTTGYGAVGPTTRNAILRLCGGTGGGSVTSIPGGICALGGVNIPHGGSYTFYSTNSVPLGQSCEGSLRTCSNGLLSGDARFAFTNCRPDASSKNCATDGVLIPDGKSVTLYRQKLANYGGSCQGISRGCVSGVLNGSSDYLYHSCTVATSPTACTLDGQQVAHGSSAVFYKQKTVLNGQSCGPFGISRFCNNGVLSGESGYQYRTCTVQAAQACTLVAPGNTASTTVAHGSSRFFYSTDKVTYAQSCDTFKAQRFCNDGELTSPGGGPFVYPSCSVTPGKNCVLDYRTVSHNASSTFYSATVPPSGKNCSDIDLDRKCTDGVLSGSDTYKYAVCAKSTEKWCLLDGTYVAHNASANFYSETQAPFGRDCSQYRVSRSCTNGTLGGGAEYKYSACAEAAARDCALDGKTVTSGTSAAFYSVRTTQGGESCAVYTQNRICIDGTLSGSDNFRYSACQIGN